MDVIILAAGYATRLYPLTKDQPKPLLPVNGRPILDYTLDKLKPIEGLGTIYCITNDRFAEHFEKWAQGKKDFKIKVINDGTTNNDNRLGAVGDIHFLLNQESLHSDCLVLGGDNLFDFGLTEFAKFARSHKPALSIGAYDCKDLEAAKQFGLVKINAGNKVIEFQEKPEHPKTTLVAMCLYFFPEETLKRVAEYMSSGESQDAPGHYIQWSSQEGEVYAHVFKDSWFDIGNLEAYEEANKWFSK
jgi:glucose-1-phosphate thymidylyltransferase